MPNRRVFAAVAILIASSCMVMPPASAQSPTSFEGEQIRSEIYFGSDLGGGQTVSDQAWDEFVSVVIRERLPGGFTVIDAAGKGTRADGPLNVTRIVVVVHPATADADARLSEIKAEYKRRFGSAGVFHVDEAVRVRP
jgi:Protein of unknown function (DUF3574)